MVSSRKITLGLLLLDALAVFLCINAATLMRGISTGLVIAPLLVPIAVSMITIYLIDGYRARTDMMSLDYTSQHAIALLTALLLMLLLTYVVVQAGYELQSSRIVLIVSYLALIPVTLSYRRIVYARSLSKIGVKHIVFVGEVQHGPEFQEECNKVGMRLPVIYTHGSKQRSGYTDSPFATQSTIATAAFDDILERIERGELAVEAIVLRESNRDLPDETAQRLMRLHFNGVPTYTLELFHQTYWRKIPLYRLNPTWLFQEGFPIAREPVFERFKRASDVLLAAAGLILASPVILLAAVAIWINDRGPVFFTQTRIGKNRRPFKVVKLRTMRVKGSSDLYTRAGDARITRAGAFLRHSRLDELPQLWNVLKGDMSLIGPRAEWDQLVARYEKEIPCYHFRHLVKPGITGWAQVNYPYGENLEDTIRKLEYDLYYIRHFSFALDAAIILKTIHIMLFGKGR